MNCDVLARSYKTFEYAAFGRRLERHRFHFLDQMLHARRALLLGEGDGRFVAQLASRNPTVQIDCFESSARMIETAEARLRTGKLLNPARIRFVMDDLLTASFETGRYDLLVANFILDCFSLPELSRLLQRVRVACAPDAHLVISEFQQPRSGWRAWHAAAWLTTMYLFFGLFTRLETRKLPLYEPILIENGFTLRRKMSSMAGLIRSELWTLHGVPSYVPSD